VFYRPTGACSKGYKLRSREGACPRSLSMVESLKCSMYAPGFTQGRRSSSDDDSWCRIASAPAFGGGLSKNWDAVCCGILLDYFTFLAARPEHFSGRAGLKNFSVISDRKNPTHDHPTGRVGP
jgi:hypothetical protein